MADIALFVAEDFERRMKRREKGEQLRGFEFSSAMAAIASSAVFFLQAKLAQKPAFFVQQEDAAETAQKLERFFHLNVVNGFFSA
ncbi:hypothetical protein KSP39_PZI003698 [Platanthera zijinensis]|uniref:Uncharacterized protein n=1 Tax=Platanthera zijinensis TaxID=2320716 RepID=A0AAP0GDD0_9ASPA